jgi:hypothetical protein
MARRGVAWRALCHRRVACDVRKGARTFRGNTAAGYFGVMARVAPRVWNV